MDDLPKALERLYAAGIGDASWEEALRALLDELGYDGAALYAFDVTGQSFGATVPRLPRGIWLNLDPAGQADYEQEYFRLDPRFRYTLANPDARILHDRLHTEEAAMDRDPYYAWYFATQPTRYYLGWWMPPGEPVMAGLTLHRRASGGPAAPGEVARLTAYAPHIQRALLAEWRLGAATGGALGPLADDLPMGLVLLDAGGRVLQANAAASRIAARADALSLGASLEALRPVDQDALSAVIAGALRPSVPPSAPSTIRLVRRWGGPDYVLTAIPLPPGGGLFAPWRPAVCVTVVDPAATAASAGALLREAFGLTQAEARLAILIAEGETVARAADALGIAQPTARTHLAAAFRKTGTRRQAELVRLIGLLPPGG
jgi:DNA-binding CsgD family transcriptional regulator/PAS domain-containing protein